MNLTRKQKKTPRRFYAAFFTTVFRVVEKLCAVFKFIFAERKLFNPAQVALTKMLRNEAKIYQETDFLQKMSNFDIFWRKSVCLFIVVMHLATPS